jgi:hypothetical protein
VDLAETRQHRNEGSHPAATVRKPGSEFDFGLKDIFKERSMPLDAQTASVSNSQIAPVSQKALWAGRVISALAVLFLLFDGGIKLVKPASVVELFTQLGYPGSLLLGVGILELACTVVYVIPRSCVLGAILLTGFLGGAITSHLRVGDPIFTHLLFPIYVGVLIWGGLFLRESRLRALIPLRS